jgi:hypothetical protein
VSSSYTCWSAWQLLKWRERQEDVAILEIDNFREHTFDREFPSKSSSLFSASLIPNPDVRSAITLPISVTRERLSNSRGYVRDDLVVHIENDLVLELGPGAAVTLPATVASKMAATLKRILMVV